MEVSRTLGNLTNLPDHKSSLSVMGPKPKHKGIVGKKSPRKRAKRKIEDEEDSDEEVLGKGKLPKRDVRVSRNKYKIETKISAISKMAAGKMVSSVSDEMNIPVGVVSQWWLQREDIRNAYENEIMAGHDLVEDYIRLSQEDFERKRIEKFLTSNPDSKGVEWKLEKRGRFELNNPLSDDSVGDPDEEFVAEEFMQNRKKSSPQSSDDEAVTKTTKTSAKQMLTNTKRKLKVSPKKSTKKTRLSSPTKKSIQRKGIKKNEAVTENVPTVTTAAHEVDKSVINSNVFPVETNPPIVENLEPFCTQPTSPVSDKISASPSPPPLEEITNPGPSLILQSPPNPVVENLSQSCISNKLGNDPIEEEVDRKHFVSIKKEKLILEQCDNDHKTKTSVKNIKMEPFEADENSVNSDDTNLTGFLEKVQPTEQELVGRYYSPFGLQTNSNRSGVVNIKTERISPTKEPLIKEKVYIDEHSQITYGSVSSSHSNVTSLKTLDNSNRGDTLQSTQAKIANKYPGIQLSKVSISPQQETVLPKIPGLEITSSSERRLSVNSIEDVHTGVRKVRRSSIEEFRQIVPSSLQSPRPTYAQVVQTQQVVVRGGGSQSRLQRSGSTVGSVVRGGQIRSQIQMSNSSQLVRSRMPLQGQQRGRTQPRMIGVGGNLTPRQPVVARGRGVMQRSMRGATVVPSPRTPSTLRQVIPNRTNAVRGATPRGRGATVRTPQLISSSTPRNRLLNSRAAVAQPRFSTPPGQRAVTPQYRVGQQRQLQPRLPQQRYVDQGVRPAQPGRGAVRQRGQVVVQSAVRGRAAPSIQVRPGEVKRKITVELSDRQLAALKSLGIM